MHLWIVQRSELDPRLPRRRQRREPRSWGWASTSTRCPCLLLTAKRRSSPSYRISQRPILRPRCGPGLELGLLVGVSFAACRNGTHLTNQLSDALAVAKLANDQSRGIDVYGLAGKDDALDPNYVGCFHAGLDGGRKLPHDDLLVVLGQQLPHSRAVQRSRYMTLESVAPLSDVPLVSLPAVAR